MRGLPILRPFVAVLGFAGGLCAGPAYEAPFDFHRNQIVIRVRVNGHGPYNFVLDTGTHASSVDMGLAERLGSPLAAGKREGRGAGSGRAFGRATVFRTLSVGGLTVDNLPAVAFDLSGISRAMGRALHGVLGYGFLATRVTRVDYVRRRLRFSYEGAPASQHSEPDRPRGVSFPMEFRQESILPVLDDCLVNGKRLSVTLDTGSSLGLVLFPGAVRQLGLEREAREGTPLVAAGYRGAAHLTRGYVKSLVLSGLDLGAVETAFVRSGYGDEEPVERRGGNLGNAVLQDFVLTLDYLNRLVTLEPASP